MLSHACHLLMLINILDHKSSQEKTYSSEETLFSNIKRHRISEEGLNLLWTVFVHYWFHKLSDVPGFKLRVQTDTRVLYAPKCSACGRYTTCRSPWQFLPSIPNSQLQQMFLPRERRQYNFCLTCYMEHKDTARPTWLDPGCIGRQCQHHWLKPAFFSLVLLSVT